MKHLIIFENFIVALLVGVHTRNAVWGIVAFCVMILLYRLSILNGIVLLMISFVEGLFAYDVLTNTIKMPLEWAWILSIVAFIVMAELHRNFGKIENSTFGYSFMIFEGLAIGGGVYIMYGKPPIAIAIFVVVLILSLTPILRIPEFIALSVVISYAMYDLASDTLPRLYSIIAALLVLLYAGVLYMHAYKGINYIGFLNKKKRQKNEQERQRYVQEKEYETQETYRRVYNKFPELEKDYYHFKVGVCQDEFEKIDFDHDWKDYIKYLDESGRTISFNQYFEEKGLYRTRFYNRDFAEWINSDERFHKQEANNDTYESEMNIIYFAGISNIDELKKRYRDLLKIFHPDNQNGDVGASQAIQKEYEFLLKKLKV